MTVEIEGPAGGEETTLLDPKSFPIPAGQGTWGQGWTACEIERATPYKPSTAICSITEPETFIPPGGVYTKEDPHRLKIVVLLGADTPDSISTTVRASGWGVPTETVVQDELSLGPETPFGLIPGVFSTRVTDQNDVEYTQAGGHPTIAAEKFEFNWHFDSKHNISVTDHVRNANTQTPRGFVGSATATPALCPTVEEVIQNTCPLESMVGGIDLYKGFDEENAEDPFPSKPYYGKLPIYALEPEYGEPAQFAFAIGIARVIYVFAPELRAQEGYALSLNPSPIVKYPELLGARPTLCSFGAKRIGIGPVVTNQFGAHFDGCKAPDDPDANPVPLITNPTRCSGPPPTTKLVVAPWEHPNDITSDTYSSPPVMGCDEVQFEPEVSVTPTSDKADSPTGIDAEITMPTDGLEDPEGVSQANLDTATVTLPKGMSVNPAVADGLGACTEAEVKMKSNAEATCPDSSKIGTIEIETPLIRRKLTGDIYVAKQNENPFDSLLGLYMVFSSKRDGITIKIAGKVVPDPVTGQLTTVFTENPEAPFSRLVLHVKSGDRAPLINPPSCGTYAVHAELSPWSAVNPANPTPAEIVSSDSSFEVTQGPNGAPCPNGALEPKLQAGLKDTQAGARSPFVFSLSREDGTQRFSGLDLTLPQGLTAYLKGIPYCSDAALGSISETEGTGVSQVTNPSCPAASQVGTSQAGAGAGPNPFYVNTGKAYLAGPYKGAPLSVAVATPAVAGPFDLGNVVVRTPLYVNRDTAQVTAKSDPIPTILHGLLLDVRDVRVSLDRPGFTAAPTSCEPKSIEAAVRGESGATAQLSNRFQVGGCESLAFKPKLAFRLFGGTHRGSHPRLRATLTMPPGGANIASASVALPHSEFLDQAHIKTVCTRVQFAADQCPAGSVYGEAEATSPLVDYTLHGPVYLRSSSNQLPNMVAVLRGPDSQPIEVDLDGRIDSVNGGIRSSFDLVPDQPVSSFTLNMKGGKKGLLVNSRNICKGTPKATAVFTAQSGKTLTLRPALKSACKKARKGKKNGKGAAKQGKRRSVR
ncbi:MAG TPA: hypothetical protein VMR96_07810 [Solirubrobacterales bacterium]|nr:hypothetical protein [Solirubrobacterales bacterium]